MSRADAATIESATKATITQADLGPSWTVYTPAKEDDPVGPDDCADKSRLAELPTGARQTGAQLQRTGTRRFVSSGSAVFPDEESAKGWADHRKSAEFRECRRASLEKEQKAGDARLSIAVAETTIPGLGTNGLEAYARFQLKADTGSGPQDANGSFARYTFRVGRTVVTMSVDQVTTNTDPPDVDTAISNDINQAIQALYRRIG